ncbi:hypothetical protein [Sphingomonas sp. PWP1-2]
MRIGYRIAARDAKAKACAPLRSPAAAIVVVIAAIVDHDILLAAAAKAFRALRDADFIRAARRPTAR